jgi:glutaminyl-tRNA synthetase
MDAPNNPEDPSAGTRQVPFTRELWIERDDFMEDPPRQFFRLSPGREVRLRSAYLVTCTDVVKDALGEVIEVRCSYDPATRGGNAPDGRRPKATLQGTLVEPSLAEVPVGQSVQFERLGYFCPDPDSSPGRPVFNRTLTLRDTWAKLQSQGKANA